MRRLVIASVIAIVVLAAGQAAASTSTLARASIERVKFLATAAVKVNAIYVCPTGYATRAIDEPSVIVAQAGPARTKSFAQRVVCDGTEQQLSVKFAHSASGEPFDPSQPVIARVIMSVYRGDEIVSLIDEDTWASGERIADIAVPRLTFLQREEAIRVTSTYRCPDGYRPDSSVAFVSESGVGYRRKGFTSRTVCDGTYHRVSVTFRTTAHGDPFEAGGQAYAQLTLGAAPRGHDNEARASNLTTVTLNG
jgi:hypothetical protein